MLEPGDCCPRTPAQDRWGYGPLPPDVLFALPGAIRSNGVKPPAGSMGKAGDPHPLPENPGESACYPRTLKSQKKESDQAESGASFAITRSTCSTAVPI